MSDGFLKLYVLFQLNLNLFVQFFIFRESSFRSSSYHKCPCSRHMGSLQHHILHVPHARNDSSRPSAQLPTAVCLWWSTHTTRSLGPADATSVRCPAACMAASTSHATWCSRLGSANSNQPFPLQLVPYDG